MNAFPEQATMQELTGAIIAHLKAMPRPRDPRSAARFDLMQARICGLAGAIDLEYYAELVAQTRSSMN